ncbi:hypothetical protein ABK040_005957 [Willaertia magna]
MSQQQDQNTFDPTVYERLPATYIAFTSLWGCATILWIAHIIYYKKQYKLNISLQTKYLTILPILKIIQCATCIVYFHRVLNNYKNKYNVIFYLITNSFSILFEIVLFFNLLIISKGLFITKLKLERTDKRIISWNMVCLLLCQIAQIFNPFFVFPLYIVYIIIFGNVFSNITINLKHLNILFTNYEENSRLAEANIDIFNSPIFLKIKLFKNFRYLIFLFLIFYTLSISLVTALNIVNNKFKNDTYLVRSNIIESLIFIIIVIAGLLFRLRNFQSSQQIHQQIQQILQHNPLTVTRILQQHLFPNTNTTTNNNDEEEVASLNFATKQHPITQQECLCIIENPKKENNSYALALIP